MNIEKKREHLRSLIIAAICLALCLVLPFLTGQIPQIGMALSPMHIPVFLCAFLCGPRYAAIVGLVAPLLRFMLLGMPPIMPMGVAMCFELAAYGITAGMLYKLLPKKPVFIYVSLIAAMLIGRAVFGLAFMQTLGINGGQYTWSMFIAGAFIDAVPGIILHIVLIPVIIIALAPRLHKT
jgi:thiamine transporter ThiT